MLTTSLFVQGEYEGGGGDIAGSKKVREGGTGLLAAQSLKIEMSHYEKTYTVSRGIWIHDYINDYASRYIRDGFLH